MPMPVTIQDIAKKLGKSHSTVSRALHGHPGISPSTTKQVRKLAREMGYVPNSAARDLKNKRSRAIGLVIQHLDNPYIEPMVKGIEDIVFPENYILFIASSNRDLQREEHIIATLAERRVEGVIVCATGIEDRSLKYLESLGIPSIVINNQSFQEVPFGVYHDDVVGMYELVRYLVQLGHRDIAYVGNAPSGRSNHNRVLGYKKALEDVGTHGEPGFVVITAEEGFESGVVGAESLLELDKFPTAIAAFNDLTAVGVLQGLHKAGIQVPDDCSVTGFDDIKLAQYIKPSLTTFAHPKYELGMEAARLMLEVISANADETKKESIITLRGQLVIRESTGEPGRLP